MPSTPIPLPETFSRALHGRIALGALHRGQPRGEVTGMTMTFHHSG